MQENNNVQVSVPMVTYRVQLNKDFTLNKLEKILPYLKQLGVTAIYASPIWEAVPGSSHGYDQLNPLKINPEIGTLKQLNGLLDALESMGMHWMQDIVPNHMAFHPSNPWIWDLLEKGPESEFRKFFDTSYTDDFFKGPVMLPFLGSDLKEIFRKKELSVGTVKGRFVLNYYDSQWPVNEKGQQLIQAEGGVAAVNADMRKMKKVLGCQYYELCHWQTTDQRVNYRRFFTVNGLIGLNVQHPEVFNQSHSLIRKLCRHNAFSGLRIDHIDGLSHPAAYIQQLRELAGETTFIVAEKILHHDESLPRQWPLQGTTGYDFMAMVNQLLTADKYEGRFMRFYKQLTGYRQPPEAQLASKKQYMLTRHMQGELDNLVTYLFRLGVYPDDNKDITPDYIQSELTDYLINFPLYRYYDSGFPSGQPETKELEMLLQLPPVLNSGQRERLANWYRRLMQLAGPLMAKGLEDTLMYTYNRWIGLNEVGGSVSHFGIRIADFHQRMQDRALNWPYTMNATATHDTKRGEDVRARLQALSATPDRWFAAVSAWQKLNTELRKQYPIDPADEYFIYQTLTGIYPMPGASTEGLEQRLHQYLEKALREGKVRSDWAQPDEAYEARIHAFTAGLLKEDTPFMHHFKGFQNDLADPGILHALAQVILKFTCPGVPDIYQGTEGWDLSLVDPDNRRPVDFSKYASWLNSGDLAGRSGAEVQALLWQDRYSGRIKCWLIQQLAALRKKYPDLFLHGDYQPLEVTGAYRRHVLAFARHYRQQWLLVIVPLYFPEPFDWRDTTVVYPAGAPFSWHHELTGKSGAAASGLLVKSVTGTLPFALLSLHAPHQLTPRHAGVLLPVFSLPGPFGAGDMGPEAYRFARFLSRGKQRYWQLLPLGPTGESEAYSPYSAVSSMAGNPLMISPELLVQDGYLTPGELAEALSRPEPSVRYQETESTKCVLLEKAYLRSEQRRDPGELAAFDHFCRQEQTWLNDYAMFTVIRAAENGAPWYDWPPALRNREPAALQHVGQSHPRAIRKEKWLQYQFFRQWKALKTYCNRVGVDLLGDLPFYVAHHSADVWAHRRLFRVAPDGTMDGVAGVPPDYFNADGQLWGMPVYRWEVHAAEHYAWWVQRLRKNMELYDLLRLDHFRAFHDYWEVPAGETVAVNGRWKPGPGRTFFETIRRELGSLPFIAEDLGDLNEGVYRLRDDVGLPGMKVLQFAFGGDMNQSLHAPHQYTRPFVAYTGTHDNNTSRGWYTGELDGEIRKQVQQYAGVKVTAENVSRVLTRMAYASVAETVIIPMQDLLNLDGQARLNTPASATGNWVWRLLPGQATEILAKRLGDWVSLYGRG